MEMRFLFIVLFISTGILLHSQEIQKNDSVYKDVKDKNIFKNLIEYFEKSNEEKTDKDFDVSFIGGPYYSNDTKLGLGLVASGLYRTDKNDPKLSPSDVSLYGNLTTSGCYAIGISGNTIFPHDNYRLIFDLFFASMPGRYWGIGYDKGKNKNDYSKYTENQVQLKADFLKKIAKYTYVGLTVTAQNVKATSIKKPEYFQDLNKSNSAIGGGLILSYDSRDFIPNPGKGIYLMLEQNFYPSALGSSQTFNRTNFIARYYKSVWKGGIIAFDFEGIFNNGHVPWNMVAKAGGSRKMRGYYLGQYRDEKLIESQIELRQKVYRRSGVALWAGAGNVFQDFDSFKWKQTLPTFGIGYRWEFKNRVNVRLDYGIGKGQTAFYFNINEAF